MCMGLSNMRSLRAVALFFLCCACKLVTSIQQVVPWDDIAGISRGAIDEVAIHEAIGLEENADIETIRSHFLVVPQKKVAICWINKNGCTQFQALFNALNDAGSNNTRIDSSTRYNSCAFSMGIDASQISRENGWFMGVFFRDPLTRFLSAYKDKCECGGSRHFCPIDDAPPDLKHRSVQDKRAAFEKTVRSLQHERAITFRENSHFIPQHSFCGGFKLPVTEQYDYVGYLSEDYAQVREEVKDMLSKGGVEWTSRLDNIFPSSAPDDKHNTGAAQSLAMYYANASIAKIVEDFYESDRDVVDFAKQQQALRTNRG
eukprot:TRINITY_DN31_c2_g1_i1.p1 TRINITY_DN31_c2_g1~~TRINITY_DN31_c2_g1_i1.p1  ORF type:complete len:316 (-),score=47.11 TRINITY_DN31_c2_g1_i1:60-1007(-)